MKKSMSLIDRVKGGARNVAVGAAIGLAALGVGAKTANAHESNPIEGRAIHTFKDFNPDAHETTGTVGMPSGTNIEILDTMPPASIVGGRDLWHVGFINHSVFIGEVVGYADNRISSSLGRVYGKYFYEILGDGNTPEDMWIAHDASGDGLGYFKDGSWNMGGDDTLYYSDEIMFGTNKIYGGVNQLPMCVTSEEMFLPGMIIDDRPPRSGPSDMNDLFDLTENWLSQDCHPYDNADCNGADWDFDGDVDFQDFSYMSSGWGPNYVVPLVSAQSISSLEGEVLFEPSNVYSTTQDESSVYSVDEAEQSSSYLIKSIKQGDETIATFE